MQPLPRLLSELEYAQSAIDRMETSRSLAAAEENWKAFLGHLERVWFKANAHYGKSPKWQPWSGKYIRERKADPLLCYLRHARDAEEHTLANVVQNIPGALTIMAGPTGSGTIRNLQVFSDGRISAEVTGSIDIGFRPDRIRLLPVKSRGVSYAVPTHHLGREVNAENVVALARYAIDYYRSFLNAAYEHFVTDGA